jgi:hypothetical protein
MQGTDMSTIDIDLESHVITLYGVRYALELFEHIGVGPVGTWLRIVKREDGVVTLERKPGGERIPEDQEQDDGN